MSDVKRFGFAFSPAYRRAARPFGVTPARAWVGVGDETLDVRFGLWRVSTPLLTVAVADVRGLAELLRSSLGEVPHVRG